MKMCHIKELCPGQISLLTIKLLHFKMHPLICLAAHLQAKATKLLANKPDLYTMLSSHVNFSFVWSSVRANLLKRTNSALHIF